MCERPRVLHCSAWKPNYQRLLIMLKTWNWVIHDTNVVDFKRLLHNKQTLYIIQRLSLYPHHGIRIMISQELKSNSTFIESEVNTCEMK